MATRIYAIAPGGTLVNVVEGVGAATSNSAINITLDLATDIVNEGGGTRVQSKEEVVLGIEYILQHIINDDWPSA